MKLTFYSACYQLIDEAFPKDVEMSKVYLQIFEKSINRINKLINELLIVSRVESGNFKLDIKKNSLSQ